VGPQHPHRARPLGARQSLPLAKLSTSKRKHDPPYAPRPTTSRGRVNRLALQAISPTINTRRYFGLVGSNRGLARRK
jgi:hypothetical protein